MVFHVVRASRDPTSAELLHNVDVIKQEFRRDAERRIMNVQKQGLVLELFGRPFRARSSSLSSSRGTSPSSTPRERALSNLEDDFPSPSLAAGGRFEESAASGSDSLTLSPSQSGGGRKKPKKSLRMLIKKKWAKLKILAMSLAGFRSKPKVKLMLTPKQSGRKIPAGQDVAREDMYVLVGWW